MASAKDLISLGLQGIIAERVGWTVMPLTSSTTAQGTGTGVIKGRGNRIVKATAHASDGSFTLPADAGEGDEIIVVNVNNTQTAVFPPSGHTVNGDSQNAAITLAANSSGRFIYLGSSLWLGREAAAPA